MSYHRDILKFAFIFVAIGRLESKRGVTMEIMNLSLNIIDSTLVKSVNHILYSPKIVYADFMISRNVNEFELRFKYDWIKANDRPLNLINLVLNGCKSMESALRAKFLVALYNEIYRNSNLPKKCPFIGNKKYVVNNFTLRDKDFRLLPHDLNWQLNVDFLMDKKVRAKGAVNGRVRQY